MTRRLTWIAMAALLAVAAFALPWRGDEAEARPVSKAAACKDEVTRLKAELATSQAALAAAQADVVRMQTEVKRLLDAERRRAKKLADQLGSPMIETLKGGDPIK